MTQIMDIINIWVKDEDGKVIQYMQHTSISSSSVIFSGIERLLLLAMACRIFMASSVLPSLCNQRGDSGMKLENMQYRTIVQ